MSKKIYLAIMPPTLIIGVLLLIYLPEDLKLYVFLLPIVMWIIYFILNSIGKQRENKRSSQR